MPRTPVVTPLEVRVSDFDTRGTLESPHGFVYFDGYPNYQGQDVRVGYIGGFFSEENEGNADLHDTTRYQPYVFTANWGEPNYSHIIEAWDFMVRADRRFYESKLGFASYADANPDTIRWMNGSEFVGCDRFTLQMAANRERQQAVRATRPARRAARAAAASEA